SALGGRSGVGVVVRLKANRPELFAAAQRRFRRQAPTAAFPQGGDHVEVWDADDLDPWETLRWATVRVLFYRQHKPDGQVVPAYWLTDFPLAKSAVARCSVWPKPAGRSTRKGSTMPRIATVGRTSALRRPTAGSSP